MSGWLKKDSKIVKAQPWVNPCNAVCPICGYDYSKIDYKFLSENSQRTNVPKEKWLSLIGPGLSVDWMLEFSPAEMKKDSFAKYMENEPYRVECLNCGNTVVYDEGNDILESNG